MTLCVLLWPVDGQEEQLAAYEGEVLALLGRHGARLVSRVRNERVTGDQPLEVQLIELPDEAALEAFMRDPERLALAGRRDRCVARTEMLRVSVVG